MLESGNSLLVMIAVFAISFAIGYRLFRYQLDIVFVLLVPVLALSIIMLVVLWLIHGLTWTRVIFGPIGVLVSFVWGDDCAYKKDAKANQAILDAKNATMAELLKNNGKTWG